MQAMQKWHVSAVRVGLNEDCWLGINGVPAATSGAFYVAAIKAYVQQLLDSGFYVILELHWTAPGAGKSTAQMPMPDADHAPEFWTSVATAFKSQQQVIFDLFNEPFPGNNTFDSPEAWGCWRDGGASCADLGYAAVGMQQLVNTVRATGATNILLLSGIAYANSLTRWLDYRPADAISQLAAGWHSYSFNPCNNPTCWSVFVKPTADQVPVVVSELGETDCGYQYVGSLVSWLDGERLSYLAWTFDNYTTCELGPSLVTDAYAGACTPAYGCGFLSHLQQIQ